MVRRWASRVWEEQDAYQVTSPFENSHLRLGASHIRPRRHSPRSVVCRHSSLVRESRTWLAPSSIIVITRDQETRQKYYDTPRCLSMWELGR